MVVHLPSELRKVREVSLTRIARRSHQWFGCPDLLPPQRGILEIVRRMLPAEAQRGDDNNGSSRIVDLIEAVKIV